MAVRTWRLGPERILAGAVALVVSAAVVTFVRPSLYPYAVAGAASILLAILAIADPFAGLAGALAYAVLANFLKRLAFAFSGAEVGISLAALAPLDVYLVVASLALLFRPSRLRPLAAAPALVAAWGGLLVVGLCSTLANGAVPLKARLYAIESCILPALFFPLAAGALGVGRSERDERPRRLLAVFGWLGLGAAAYATAQAVFGLLPFERAWAEKAAGWSRMVYDIRFHMKSIGQVRYFSVLSDHQSFGLLEAASLAAVISLGSRGGRRAWLAAIPFLAAGLFLCLTRAAWLVAVLAVVALADRRLARKNLWWTWAILLVLSVPATVLVLRAVAGPRPSLGGGGIGHRIVDTGSLEARLHGWKRLGENRLFGVGYGDAPFFAAKFAFKATTSGAHNFFVELDEKVGHVGECLFAAVALLGLRAGWKQRGEEDRNAALLRRFASAVFFGLLIGGNFYGAAYLNGSFVGMLFWMSLGLAI